MIVKFRESSLRALISNALRNIPDAVRETAEADARHFARSVQMVIWNNCDGAGPCKLLSRTPATATSRIISQLSWPLEESQIAWNEVQFLFYWVLIRGPRAGKQLIA